MSEVTRDDLAAALDGFYLAVRTHAEHQESGQIAHPDKVADTLHATLSRIAAEKSPDLPAKAAGVNDGPYAREIGRIEDGQGRVVIVGVSRGTVTLRTLHTRTGGAVELTGALAEEFGQLYISACWAAAEDCERLARAGAGISPAQAGVP